METIPFNRPFVPESSRDYLKRSLASGHLSGDGPMTSLAVDLLRRITCAPCILLTPSCTHALELACRLLDLGRGDEVILPSFNFTSAATAVALTGATPVFVDVDMQTRNVEVEGILAALTARTRAVIVLHYGGRSAPVHQIREIMDAVDGHVIEDVAHGLGTVTNYGILGSVGTFSTYSFHETKNVQCGEGGALQINDPAFVERAEILREKGTNRKSFFQGQVDKYSWIDQGSSWLLADPLAALLLGQLEEFEAIHAARRLVFDCYASELRNWGRASGFSVASAPEGQENPAHTFSVIAPDVDARNALLKSLRHQGVSSAFHYQPLDVSPAGERLGRSTGCPNSVQLGDRLVRLPIFVELTMQQIDRVVTSVLNS